MPVHGKALFLLLESSGMRIGEGLQLKLNDLALDKEPGMIQIKGEYTKTGNSRYAFISREAKETITEWLNVRRGYLAAAVGKSHLYDKSIEDDKLFPFLKDTAYKIWRRALKKAKLDEIDKSTNRHTLHPHLLRKFLRTRLGAVISVDVIEALMGHEGYLTEVYRRYTVEDLAKYYLQGESALLIFTEAAEVSKLRQEVEDKNKQLQTLVTSLSSENLEMKNELVDMKSKIRKLEDVLLDLKKTVDHLAT